MPKLIAGQQDPAVAVPFGLPGLEPVARQPGHVSQGKIRTEHAADAVLELGQGHRRVIADVGGLVFGGLHEQAPVCQRAEPEHAAVCPGETRADPAQPGDVEVAVVQPGHRIGQGDLGQPVDLRIGGAGEPDPGGVADLAVRAVAAHQVASGHPVGPVRAAHIRGYRGVVLADPGYLVSAAYAGAEFAGAVAEQPLEPRLREMHDP
jgi:hypothetical protein